MNFSDLSRYLHQWQPHELPGLIVDYDISKQQGYAMFPGHEYDGVETYSVRPAFDSRNPNNSYIESSELQIAKSGRLNTHLEHDQNYYETLYVLEGSVDCTVNGISVHIPAGAMLLMTAGISHFTAPLGPDDIAVSFYFERSYVTGSFYRTVSQLSSVGNIYKSNPNAPFLLIEFGVNSQADIYGRTLLCNYFDPNSHSPLSTSLLFQLFLTEADATLNKTLSSSEQGIDAKLSLIARYIELHCATVTLAEVAHQFGYTENYISSAIRRKFGVSFTRYRNLFCVQAAAAMLYSTNLSITEIAAEVGLNSLSHFYKLFTAEYGIAPAEYRSRHRMQP